MPAYLANQQDGFNLVLAMFLVLMFADELVIDCFQYRNGDFKEQSERQPWKHQRKCLALSPPSCFADLQLRNNIADDWR